MQNNDFKNVDFIDMYFDYIKNYQRSIKLFEKKEFEPIEKEELIRLFKRSPFLSQDLGDKLEKKILSEHIRDYIYKLDLSQGTVFFHFVTDKNIKTINKLAKYYFFVLFLRLNYNNVYKRLNFPEHVYINIVGLDEPKRISVPITIDDINSASTIIFENLYGGPIFIWREDELEKVLIHETLHSMHYDWDLTTQKMNGNILKIANNINGGRDLSVNEAYTELCASFLRALFELGDRQMDKRTAKKKLKDVLEKELKHSFENCGKLLFKYEIDDFSKLISGECNYKQEANAFSYIIVKTGLLWSILENCKSRIDKHTDKLKCLEDFLGLGFWGSIGGDYQRLVEEILEDESFINLVNKNIKKKVGRPENLFFTIF